MIIGLTGPSGVGKGFIKEHLRAYYPEITELTVVTTRPRRPSDGRDRETDIPATLFLQKEKSGEIIFAHQPYGAEGDWYGFVASEIGQFIDLQTLVLTEIHVDNVLPFKEKYGDTIIIVGLHADRRYLEQNLVYRDTENPEQRSIRLDLAAQEGAKIVHLFYNGDIDELIEVKDSVRGELVNIARSRIEILLQGRRGKEWEEV